MDTVKNKKNVVLKKWVNVHHLLLFKKKDFNLETPEEPVISYPIISP